MSVRPGYEPTFDAEFTVDEGRLIIDALNKYADEYATTEEAELLRGLGEYLTNRLAFY